MPKNVKSLEDLSSAAGVIVVPKFSIIVPTRNEEVDIRTALEALVRLRYNNIEIIVVDDSTDNTRAVVREFENNGVTLLAGQGRGRCAARNVGILKATGDIVVILNADVLLPPDFINSILRSYNEGADYVLVEAEVANTQSLFPRYVQAIHHYCYDGQNWIEWTEGFSCKRQAAIEIGLFPTDLPVPLVAGEDGYFGMQLARKYKKVIDRSVVITHIAPETFGDYWRARKEKGSPLARFFLEGVPLSRLLAWLLLKSVYVPLRLCCVLPAIIESYKITRYSPRKSADLIPFLYAHVIQQIAMLIGSWEGMIAILKNRSYKK